MASFYGWKHEYMLDLEVGIFNQYLGFINTIEAQRQMMRFTAGDWPNLKKEKRKTIMGAIKKEAFPKILRPTENLALTPERLREIINADR